MSKRSKDEDVWAALRERTERLMRRTIDPDKPAGHPDSAWTRFATAVVEASVEASPTPLMGPGLDVLKSLAGVEEEQTKLLRSIEQQVTLLRAAPFQTGRDLLEEAARRPDHANDCLHDALREFRQARNLSETPVERGVVELHLGAVWLLLGDREESRERIETAYKLLSNEVARLVEESGDIHVLKTRRGTAVASYFGLYTAPFVLAKKFKKVRGAERARLTLTGLEPLVAAVARSVPAVGGEQVPAYSLQHTARGWTLEEIVPT